MASSTVSTAKRQSSAATVPQVARPQSNIHASAVVADKAQLIGPHVVEIGEDTVVHPYARLQAEHGNVIVGKKCIIAEKATVGPLETAGEAGCMLGDGVSIESGAVVAARRIGAHTTIEVNAKVGSGSVIGNWCRIGPLCEVAENDVLEDYTVIFGSGQRRLDRVTKEKKEIQGLALKGREKEIELLRALIPDAKLRWQV